MRKIKLLLGASILLLVSAQAGAGILLEGAELWKYSVEGSVSNNLYNNFPDPSITPDYSDISGFMLIDTTVRDYNSLTASPQQEPCNGTNACQAFMSIVGYGLSTGDEHFFGGDLFAPVRSNSLYIEAQLCSFGFCTPGEYIGLPQEWYLEPIGDFAQWRGGFTAYKEDGTIAQYPDLFEEAPASIELRGGIFGFENEGFAPIEMTLTRVARVPEPATIALFGIGLLGMIGFSKRRKVA